MAKRGRPRKYTKENKPKKTPSVLKFGDALDTDDKRKVGISILTSGKSGEFWRLLLNTLDYNIEQIEFQILNDDELTFEKREELRWRRYYMVELRNLPDNLINSLTPIDASIGDSDLDPYDK